MSKNGALCCSIIFYVFGLGSLVPTIMFPETITLFTIGAPMFLIVAIVMTFVYLRIRKSEKQAEINYDRTISDNVVDDEFDEEKFDEWLKKFEPLTKLGAKLIETQGNTFSKFGGMPVVPKEFKWPTAFNWVSNSDDPIPFLLQIDFSEINPDGELKDFPTKGLLYVFVEGENYDYKVLFYDKPDELTTAVKPESLEIIYKEFHISAEVIKTYPDCDDCKEAFELYCDRPFGGADDDYDELQKEHMDGFMIGGWAAYVQEGGVAEQFKENENDAWILLAQIGSVGDDDNFMWGDAGTLYFYIREEDLKSHNFGNVKLEMQCY